MAEEQQNPPPSLAQVWQMPVLALSLIFFGIGLWLASAPQGPAGDGGGQTLDALEQQVRAGRYQQAIETGDELAEQLDAIPDELHGRYHELMGDAVSLAMRGDGGGSDADHRRVIESYRQARQREVELDAEQAERLADSLAALGELDSALAVLGELGSGGAQKRQQLLRRPIEQAMAAPAAELDAAKVERAIDRLLAEDGLTVDNEVWATARHAELLMRTGRAPAAIDMLLRRLARLQDAENAELGGLKLKLAQAYLDEKEMANAERWLLRAQEDLESDDPRNGDVMVALGQIRFAEGNAAEAVEHFTAAVKRYRETDTYSHALLGKAESEARLGRQDAALEDYSEAVTLVLQGEARASGLRGRLIQSLETQHDLRFGQNEFPLALRYLQLQRQLHEEPPADLFLQLAVTHQRLAEQLADDDASAESEAAATQVDPVVARRVAEHQAAAADAYLAHADAVAATDDDAFGQSLWQAGRLYDSAGLHRRAVGVFERYIEERPEDPQRLSAIFRLAQAHRADGRPGEAVPLYTQLIEENPNAPEAYASLVPLARSYLAMGPEYTDRAEQVLVSVVTDHEALRPDSTEFRQALIELGQLYYHRGDEGDYEKAIARLSEVIERYGRDEPMPELLFQLGDAYRKSVEQIDERLDAALPPSQRADLTNERATRLHEAQESFDQVILMYEDRDPRSLTELQELYLRNSYFYRADCAYDLGHYEGPDGSIALYEKAVQRYDEDPAALVGLVQIVNSHAELGDWDKARTANERAKVYLEAIPEQAFDDPNLPMSREHWQRWLDWSSELALSDRAAVAE